MCMSCLSSRCTYLLFLLGISCIVFIGWSPAVNQLIYERVCEDYYNHDLAAGPTHAGLTHRPRGTEGLDCRIPEVESTANAWITGISLCSSIPSLLSTTLMGAASDRFGRRPLLIFTFVGLLVMTSTGWAIEHYHLSLSYFYAVNVISGSMGSAVTLFMNCFAYISDVTDKGSERGLGIALVEASLFISSAMGPIIEGLITHHYGRDTFFVCGNVGILCCLFVSLFLKESMRPHLFQTGPMQWKEVNPFVTLGLVCNCARKPFHYLIPTPPPLSSLGSPFSSSASSPEDDPAVLSSAVARSSGVLAPATHVPTPFSPVPSQSSHLSLNDPKAGPPKDEHKMSAQDQHFHYLANSNAHRTNACTDAEAVGVGSEGETETEQYEQHCHSHHPALQDRASLEQLDSALTSYSLLVTLPYLMYIVAHTFAAQISFMGNVLVTYLIAKFEATSIEIGYVLSFGMVSRAVMVLCLIYTLQKVLKLNDLDSVKVALIFASVTPLLYSFATSMYQLYLIPIVQGVGSISTVLIRATISSAVSASEQGKAFSAIALVQTLASVISNALLGKVYSVCAAASHREYAFYVCAASYGFSFVAIFCADRARSTAEQDNAVLRAVVKEALANDSYRDTMSTLHREQRKQSQSHVSVHVNKACCACGECVDSYCRYEHEVSTHYDTYHSSASYSTASPGTELKHPLLQ